MNEKNSEEKNAVQKHSHAGHRDRVKETVLKKGFGHMYDHELLEFLLFYAIPRRDTNQLAHELIETFGSLNGVLDADVERLAECPGMGQSSALMLKALKETSVRYVNNSEEPFYRYDKLHKVAKYVCNFYIGATREMTIALLFDNKMKLLDRVEFGEGTVNASQIDMFLLTKRIIQKNAAGVILAHNHPDGILKASYEDEAVTRKIFDFLRQMSIPLLEHLLVYKRDVYPMLHYSGIYDVASIAGDRFGENFFHHFFESGFLQDEENGTLP